MKKFMYLVVVSMVVITSCSSLEQMNARYDDEIYSSPKGDRDLIIDSSAYQLKSPQSINSGSNSNVAPRVTQNNTDADEDRNFDSVQDYYYQMSRQNTGDDDLAQSYDSAETYDSIDQDGINTSYYYYGYNDCDDYYYDDYYYNGFYSPWYYDNDPYWSVSLGLGLWPFYWNWGYRHHDYYPYHNDPVPLYYPYHGGGNSSDVSRQTQRRTSLEDTKSGSARQASTITATEKSGTASSARSSADNRYVREARTRDYYQRKTYNGSSSSTEKSQTTGTATRSHTRSEDRAVSRPTSRSSDDYQYQNQGRSARTSSSQSTGSSSGSRTKSSQSSYSSSGYSSPRSSSGNETYSGSSSSGSGSSRPSSSGGSRPSSTRR